MVSEQHTKAAAIVSAETALHGAKVSLVEELRLPDGTGISLAGARLGYYGFHEAGKTLKRFLPTWQFTFEARGFRYQRYVNALSNELLDHRDHIAVARTKIRR